MSNQAVRNTMKTAAEAIAEKMKGKMHAWVSAEVYGKETLICIWATPSSGAKAEVIGDGVEHLKDGDVLTMARAFNKSMKATPLVVSMLVDLYRAHNKDPVGQNIRY